MKFKDFKQTDTYLCANVIYFIDTNGENCEDIDEVIDNMEVVKVHSNNGYLELVLDYIEDNTYGCDVCGKRKDWDTEIHWITSSYGVCDECYDKLDKEEIERLEKTYE